MQPPDNSGDAALDALTHLINDTLALLDRFEASGVHATSLNPDYEALLTVLQRATHQQRQLLRARINRATAPGSGAIPVNRLRNVAQAVPVTVQTNRAADPVEAP